MNRAEAIKVLESLGENADEVAQSLKDKGIKGVRLHPCECPLAKLIGGYFSYFGGTFVFGKEAGFELPRACREFIAAFDRGAYPEIACAPAQHVRYVWA